MHRLLHVVLLATLAATAGAAPKLDQRCTVSVLNRISHVRANGYWIIRNIPANQGAVRAVAT